MKYFVVAGIAGRGFVVSVDANSAGVAEHAVLDLLPIENGFEFCQAFSKDEIGTDTFLSKALLPNMETISLKGLAELCGEYMVWEDKRKDVADRISSIGCKELALRKQIEALHSARTNLVLESRAIETELNKVFATR